MEATMGSTGPSELSTTVIAPPQEASVTVDLLSEVTNLILTDSRIQPDAYLDQVRLALGGE